MAVIVKESGKGKYTEEITVGNHILTADEPVANGGNDTGPSPYDFILAGLGACTAMTLRMYADFKKIPLKKVTVNLSHEKVYAEDCENCANNNNAKMDHISRLIHLEGDLSEDQRSKLLKIANQCPVHRTLTSTITIDTKLD